MVDLKQCQSARNHARGLCKDGWPQGASCLGIHAGVPVCCNETVAARIYPESGAPPQRILDKIAKP